MRGRIVEVRSTKQSVIKVLTPKSFIFLNVSRGTFGLSVFPPHVSRGTFGLSVFLFTFHVEHLDCLFFLFTFHVKHLDCLFFLFTFHVKHLTCLFFLLMFHVEHLTCLFFSHVSRETFHILRHCSHSNRMHVRLDSRKRKKSFGCNFNLFEL